MGSTRGRGWGALIGVVTTMGCAAAPPAEAPPPRERDSYPTPPPPAEPAEKPVSSEPEAAPAPPAETPPPPPPAAALCEGICKKLDAGCKERAAQICRVNCEDYVRAEEKCPVEVERALTCQTNADDLILCSNMAAESCVQDFHRLAQCRAGKVPPATRDEAPLPAAHDEEVPSGWKRREVVELGISLLLPEPASRETKGAIERIRAESGGVEYYAENLPNVPKPTDRTILKAALDYLGLACQPKLKLHGRFETADVIHVRFDTVCKDGTSYRGMFHFWDDRVVVSTLRAPSKSALDAADAHLETFLFGVRVTRPGR